MAKRELLDYYGEKKTKKQIGEMCQKMLNENEDGQVINKRSSDYQLALWVYRKRVGELISPLIFCVRTNLDGHYKALHFLNKEGKWEAISYLKALKTDKQNKKKDVIKAFRQEVNQQISSFRQFELESEENVELAALNQINPNKVHTDHIIPLKDLITDFLTRNEQGDISSVEIEAFNDSKGRKWLRLKDRALALKWQRYHLEEAELQLTTSKENLQLAVSRRKEK